MLQKAGMHRATIRLLRWNRINILPTLCTLPYLFCNKHLTFLCVIPAQKPDGERDDLGEFLYQYLQRRFGVENMIIEWGYNLYDACGRYSHDPRIGLFYGILQKEVGVDI